MKRLAVFLPLLASSGVYAFEATPYIVNGTQANIANYPSFSSLYFDDGRFYGNFCGSTIINSEYILTAAHCIYGDYNRMLHTWAVPQVTNESGYLNGDYESVRAVEFYYPDGYVHSSAQKWPNDIAIIKLARPLSGAPNYISKLNFDNAKSTLQRTGGYKAIGHGLIEGNVDSDGILLETDLTFTFDSRCGTSEGQLCFDGALDGNYKNSTCKGDSGGPVYADFGTNDGYVQIGITSFGPESCGDRTEPATSAFTNIHYYQNWINRVINGGEIPKYHIVTEGDTRQLVENVSANVKATNEHTDAASSSGGSGGSLGWLSLLTLGFFGLRKKRVN